MLSVTETVSDPYYQRRGAVTALAASAGFVKHSCFGNSMAYTLNLKKP